MLIADRLAAMGTLAAGVAHEINNPLTYTLGNVHRALAHLEAGAPFKKGQLQGWLNSAAEGADHVARIVRDLNTFTRAPEEGLRGPVEVEKAIESSLTMAMSTLKHKASLVREYEPELMILGEATRLGQVILNLVVNALYAMSDDDLGRNELRIRTFKKGDQVIIEVSDNGPGIPPQILPRIFEPFFTTKPVGLGSGLGLFICKNLIERMEGVMEVSSTKTGTTFRIGLEYFDGPCVPVATQNEDSSFERQRTRKILVVDDQEEIAELLKDLLYEHDVDICTNGQEALERLEGSDYDLVLCDLMMPTMTGMELYDRCRAKGVGLEQRFIFLTGGAFTNAARVFLDKIDNPTVHKPFSAERIREEVARMR